MKECVQRTLGPEQNKAALETGMGMNCRTSEGNILQYHGGDAHGTPAGGTFQDESGERKRHTCRRRQDAVRMVPRSLVLRGIIFDSWYGQRMYLGGAAAYMSGDMVHLF